MQKKGERLKYRARELKLKVISSLIIIYSPQNLIAQSQSGTGKTAAFVLAMLTRVDASKPYPQVIITPSLNL